MHLARPYPPLAARLSLVRYRRIPSTTAGYVISRSGAAKLLAKRQPFGRPVDVDLRFWWEADRLKVLGVVPSVLALDETSDTSTIREVSAPRSHGERGSRTDSTT